MSLVVKTHPLAEILAKKLLGIEGVPKKEQSKMVAKAIKAAVEFYDNKLQQKDIADAKQCDNFKCVFEGECRNWNICEGFIQHG